MTDGWIKAHRRIQLHWLWKEKPFSRAQAWFDLLLTAAHQDTAFIKRGIKIPIKKGQVATSMKGLADRWGWSQPKVKRFLTRLKTDSQIVYQITNVTTVITITNWDTYQGDVEQNVEQTLSKRRPNDDIQEGRDDKSLPSSTLSCTSNFNLVSSLIGGDDGLNADEKKERDWLDETSREFADQLFKVVAVSTADDIDTIEKIGYLRMKGEISEHAFVDSKEAAGGEDVRNPMAAFWARIKEHKPDIKPLLAAVKKNGRP